jgi:predicted dehydrogenase
MYNIEQTAAKCPFLFCVKVCIEYHCRLINKKKAEIMKYALIGCGRVSPSHIKAAIENRLEIVGICDIRSQSMESLITRFEVIKDVNRYVDYIKMLETEKPELVAIATDSGSHASIALNCIEHGCNVIIEKPIALSIEDADRIIEAGKRMGVKVCANHQNRFNKAVQKLRSAIKEDRFGKLFHCTVNIRWMRDKGYFAQDAWRGTWESDGGTLMNQCIHGIDLLRWIMGDEVAQVFGMTDNLNHSYIEAEDLGLALVKFRNGGYGVVEGTTNTYNTDFEHSLTVFGEKGFVRIGGTNVNTIEQWRFEDGLDSLEDIKEQMTERASNVYGFGHTPLYRDVIDAIKSNREPYVDAYAGKRALELVLAIYKSAAIGEPVNLPLYKCATTDFTGRFNR